MIRTVLSVLFIGLCLSSCDSSNIRQQEVLSYRSMPVLKPLERNKTYTLRLLRVYDPELPDLTEEQYASLYQYIEKTAKEYVGYQVRIIPQKKINILKFFNQYSRFFSSRAAQTEILSQYIDFSDENGKKRVRDTIIRAVQHLGSKIKNYIPTQFASNFERAVNYLYNEFTRKFNEIRKIKIHNKTFFRKDYAFTQSYVHLSVILRHLQEADFIVTNTMIAGADSDMPIYVILRGGITSGFVDGNFHNAPYNAAGMVGLFQFISNAPFFIKERRKIPGDTLLPLIALMFGHEFGHFFARYKEMYVPEAGIHATSTGLDYLNWYKRVVSMKNRHPIYGIEQLTSY